MATLLDFQDRMLTFFNHSHLNLNAELAEKKKPRLCVEAYFFLKCFSSLFLSSHEFVENLLDILYQSEAKIKKSFNDLELNHTNHANNYVNVCDKKPACMN